MSVQVSSALPGAPGVAVCPESASGAEAEKKYLEVLNVLFDEAVAQQRLHILADCLAWELARIVKGCDSMIVAGRVMEWFGTHLKQLAERTEAQREAEEAKAAGVKPS